jgi:hypothetical protein
MNDVFVYIAGPISPKNGYLAEENVLEGMRTHLELVKNGIPNYCPQLDGAFPSSWTQVPYEKWLEVDLSILNRCTHVLMLPRWEESTGAVAERAVAQKRGIPIAYSVAELVLMLEK